jgi:Glycosyl hydrolase family 98 C-terminal domain/Glycosyl hydrolase family 98
MIYRVFLILFLLSAALTLVSCTSDTGSDESKTDVDTLRPECDISTTGLRREISRANPLIIENLYPGATTEMVDAFVSGVPADLLPYFAFQIILNRPCDDIPENREWAEWAVSYAQSVNIPSFIQAEIFYTSDNLMPHTFYQELFDRYPLLIGLSHAELSAGNLSLEGMNQGQMDRIEKTIETVAANDAYFLWQDMGYDIPEHVFLQAGGNETLLDTIKSNARNIIIMDKHNGRGKRFTGPAAILGLWTTCLIGNWGVNPEDWLWWEAGYGPADQPSSGQNQNYDATLSRFSYPLAMFGIDWTVALSAGATVFSSEIPVDYSLLAREGIMNQGFSKVMGPLFRLMIEEGVIPSRKQVREKMKVAYHPQEIYPPEIEGDQLFADLYGPEESDLFEWLPSTGRYYFLPILPVLSEQELLDYFPETIDSIYYADFLTGLSDKQEFFNRNYPEIGSGDAWFVNVGNVWYLINPNEGTDQSSSFEFESSTVPGMQISGSLPPHTFLIIIEKEDSLKIHLSNYCYSPETDIWAESTEILADWGNWYNDFVQNPQDDELRETLLTITANFIAEPNLVIEGDNGFAHVALFDSVGGEYSLAVNHNGPVEVEIAY